MAMVARGIGALAAALAATVASASPLHTGAQLHWTYSPVGDAPGETAVYRVLSAGPTHLLQTDAKPFDFGNNDYSLFIEYRVFGFFDCRESHDADEVMATLAMVDALYPLEAGKVSGRFAVTEAVVLPALPAGVAAGGAEEKQAWRVVETLAPDDVISVTYAPSVGYFTVIDWADGSSEALDSVTPAIRPDARGVIPPECRNNLPDAFWRKLGLADLF